MNIEEYRRVIKIDERGKPGWLVRFGWLGFWWKWWTPTWHEGRGPYISMGLGLLAIYRGY